jgi:TRAP-type C4-dicarboxylate transport system permease small subunit
MNAPTWSKLEQNFEGYVATVMLIAYTLLISYTIFQRLTFQDPPQFTLSVTLFLFTWMTWLTAGWAIRHESHFRFTLLRSTVSDRANYLLRYLDLVAWVGFAGIITRYSIPLVLDRMEYGREILGTPIPLWTAYLAIPVGMGIVIVRAIQRFVQIRRAYEDGEDVTPTSSIEI